MVCLECWYYRNIKQKIFYPIKNKFLQWLTKCIVEKKKDCIGISGGVVAEIYDGSIEDGKLTKTFTGTNKWTEWGLDAIWKNMYGMVLYYIGTMGVGTQCSDTAFTQTSTLAPIVSSEIVKGYPSVWVKAIANWGTSGIISNICQAALFSKEAGPYTFSIYNFSSAFTKQDGQSLKITYTSTLTAQ